ncbi:MAG: HisA/HisF-related TIM barrel protein [Methanomicrobiales archaeon]|nr:HisA/HisF-related TIM barrel protein [Methanomicrobiales archaeon]MDI6877080.1 HisA/HisF-related TIM barrel protein [Methanomicrobiales archaeon]
MDLILAMDLMQGKVVHGVRGERSSYLPLTWGLVSTADPIAHVHHIAPRFLYIADLDRIMGTGSHDREIESCVRLVERCFLDRGVRSTADCLQMAGVINVVGTETGGRDLGRYTGGYLSIDHRDGRVIPCGWTPAAVLGRAGAWAFDGCILLNIGAVGTERGLDRAELGELRSAYRGRLIYGGGVRAERDLDLLEDLGFDGAIVATAVHRGAIPLASIRRGIWS